MVERRRLHGGLFKPGNKASVGNCGLPAVRRLTNRYFAETLFRELTALHPKTQQQRWTRIIRRAIQDAEADGELARRFVVDVLNRFVGQPTMPIAWKDYTDREAERNRVPMITRDMSDAEAARIVQGMLRRSQGEDEDRGAVLATANAMERASRLNDGPDGPPDVIDVDPEPAPRRKPDPEPDEDEDGEEPIISRPHPNHSRYADAASRAKRGR